jgi:hypothetical protein
VALTTQTSEWAKAPVLDGRSYKLFFGRVVPKNVVAVELMRDAVRYELHVRWRVKADDTIHEMPFQQTDEGVMAALVAMKLTC